MGDNADSNGKYLSIPLNTLLLHPRYLVMSDSQQPGLVLSFELQPAVVIPTAEIANPGYPSFRSFILEWYKANFQSAAIYSQIDRRDASIVPYHHPMTIEVSDWRRGSEPPSPSAGKLIMTRFVIDPS
jgi:hypothetical protein